MQPERRTHRSDNILEALSLQLASTARRAGFTSLLLAEGQGLPVAGAGPCADLEEIAALAPGLAPGALPWQGTLRRDGWPTLVTVLPVSTGDGPVFLCAAGGHGSGAAADLLHAGLGVSRILA
jgi:hypothetical protein